VKEASRLKGYSYSHDIGRKARDNGQILSVRVETSLLCNMRCRYCGWNSGIPLDDEVGFDTLINFISEAKEMGAKSVVIIGGGEPTIYTHFKELVTYINQEDLIPVVITNGLTTDIELAKFLFENNCSVLIKCDSFKAEVQDYLSGMDGAYKKIQYGLKSLIEAGFTKSVSDDNNLRLGISFVVTSKNIDEVCDIWRFCRMNNIYPNIELLNPTGRSLENIDELLPDSKKLANIMKTISEIDEKEFQIKQIKQIDRSNHCLQHLYSVYLNVAGYVQPCGAIRIRNFNYKDNSLRTILNNDYFKKARSKEIHLDENVELTSFNV